MFIRVYPWLISENAIALLAQYQYLQEHPFSTLHDLLSETIHLSVFFSGITVCYVLLRQAEDGVSLTETDGGKPGASM